MPQCLILLLLAAWLFGCQREPVANTTTPVTLTRGEITLTADPAVGGRLASVTFGGTELLQTNRDSANLTWGSVGWTSPQTDWDWPPPTAFDSEPYTATLLGEHRLLLEGPLDTASMMRMRKRYVLGPDNDIGLTYWITYEGHKSASVALWENTRLPYAGRFEFATDSVRFTKSDVAIDTSSGRSVLVMDDRHPTPGKLFTSLRDGYVDWVYRGIRLRKNSIVKEHYRVAPGQAPLELYVDPIAGFAEMELQGDYRLLGAGESNSMRIKWSLSRE